MTKSSASILERFRRSRATDIDLTLRAAYRNLLEKLGNPNNRLPPVIHVAGTNGKGSTCAFLRAMIEAAGYKAHVYTSPHLVSFHERIRIAGELIGEAELCEILSDCERLAEPAGITFFEAATIAAFVAFARYPANVAILEVGLGGRLDATNVVSHPAATVITRLSFDHRDYLGDSLDQITREKAGIMKPGTPCFTAPQPSSEALTALQESAAKLHAPLIVGGKDWRVESLSDNSFRFHSPNRTIDLPLPALVGQHQLENAGLALAALEALPLKIPDSALIAAMQRVEWPARLQRLNQGALAALMPEGWELWLDGGHNDSAGEALAAQAKAWILQDGNHAHSLHVVLGMLNTKAPKEFLAPLAPYIQNLRTVMIEKEPLSLQASDLAAQARAAGIANAAPAPNILQALKEILESSTEPGRILICGSLYLAGRVLKMNGNSF
jgi:dihydrofolate synthase/folylpolyglutamate synthase